MSTHARLSSFVYFVKELVKALHAKGIKLILDFVPNHTSDQHEWFKKSVDKIDPYTNYFVWQPGSKEKPPNNWVSNLQSRLQSFFILSFYMQRSVFGGPAWTWHDQRQEWYLHQFYSQQPDLNLRNPIVVNELKEVLNFWMKLGVDGFRVDAVPHFFEDPDLKNEELVVGQPEDSYASVDHSQTYNLQPETCNLLKDFRSVLNKFDG